MYKSGNQPYITKPNNFWYFKWKRTLHILNVPKVLESVMSRKRSYHYVQIGPSDLSKRAHSVIHSSQDSDNVHAILPKSFWIQFPRIRANNKCKTKPSAPKIEPLVRNRFTSVFDIKDSYNQCTIVHTCSLCSASALGMDFQETQARDKYWTD